MNIEILDDKTINQISAGEVVERPASALKELLENSVDSGATQIDIEFSQGGRYLKVTDNGGGLGPEDLSKALMRHATSKIRSIDDLNSLSTFGFRGEALAAISSVSNFKMRSTLLNAPRGYVLNSQGGKLSDVQPTSPTPGTTVEISDLFFNTPARLKFLKSEAGETAAIKKTCKAFALANPSTGINLSHDGKSVFRVLPQSWFDRALQVLQLKKDQCVFTEKDFNGLKIKLALGLPESCVQTSQSIWLFVNSRPVQDRTLQQAVLEGYRNLLLVGNYPQAVCDIQIDSSEVDVNVHPAKTQVKFKDSSQIFRAVSGLIKEKMTEIYSKPEIQAPSNPIVLEEPQQLFSESHIQFQEKTWEQPQEIVKTTETGFSSVQLIGQFSNTYIVGQNQKGLILIDQHAAHERVLFETLKAQYLEKNVSTQKELFEELIQLPENLIECLISENHLTQLLNLGLEIHQRGKDFIAVTARPSLLTDVGLAPILEKMATQILELGEGRVFEDIAGDLIATMACHSAIRAGKVLSVSEMQSLLVQMDKINFSQFCPHGRPVSISFSVTDVEKLFKRIV